MNVRGRRVLRVGMRSGNEGNAFTMWGEEEKGMTASERKIKQKRVSMPKLEVCRKEGKQVQGNQPKCVTQDHGSEQLRE